MILLTSLLSPSQDLLKFSRKGTKGGHWGECIKRTKVSLLGKFCLITHNIFKRRVMYKRREINAGLEPQRPRNMLYRFQRTSGGEHYH